VGPALTFGGAILTGLAIVAAVVRWRVPHILLRPRGTRSSSVAVLAVALPLLGAIAVMCLVSALEISELLTFCVFQEC
jgi:hypothetical protein